MVSCGVESFLVVSSAAHGRVVQEVVQYCRSGRDGRYKRIDR